MYTYITLSILFQSRPLVGNAIEKGDELLMVNGVTFTPGVRRVSNELVGAGRGGDSNGTLGGGDRNRIGGGIVAVAEGKLVLRLNVAHTHTCTHAHTHTHTYTHTRTYSHGNSDEHAHQKCSSIADEEASPFLHGTPHPPPSTPTHTVNSVGMYISDKKSVYMKRDLPM